MLAQPLSSPEPCRALSPNLLWCCHPPQVEFMAANPSVSVLGSSVAVFSGNCLHDDASKSSCSRESRHGLSVGIQAPTVQRIARHPTDPALVRWSLFFGCCVAHPSVILRRSAVLDAGGYDETTEPAEDYDLWLRVAEASSTSVTNSGEVCGCAPRPAQTSPAGHATSGRVQ